MKIEEIGKILTFWTNEDLITYFRYDSGGWLRLSDNEKTEVISKEEQDRLEDLYWEWKKS